MQWQILLPADAALLASYDQPNRVPRVLRGVIDSFPCVSRRAALTFKNMLSCDPCCVCSSDRFMPLGMLGVDAGVATSSVCFALPGSTSLQG